MRAKTKRKLMSVTLATVLGVSVIGCGGETASAPAPSGSTPAAPSAEKKVVEVWTNDRHDQKYVTAMVDKYNQTNTDGIEIKMTVVTDDYMNMLTMAFSSNTAPDLACVSGGMSGFDLKMVADSGMIQPMNSFLEKDPGDIEKVTDISKHHFEGMNTIGDDIYWFPTVCRSGSRMIYNKTLTDEAGMTEFPKTLAEMTELAKTITQNGNGKYYGHAVTSSASFIRCLEGIAEKSGQNPYGYDYVNGKYDFSGFKPVVEGYAKMFTDGSVLPGSASQGVDAMRAQFASGTVGLWANASQEAGVFTNQFPIDSFEWGVAELPTLDGEIHGAQSAMPQKGYLMMSNTDVPEEAWKVIRFFSSEEFVKGYLQEGYALPFSKHMNETVDLSAAGKIAEFGSKEYENVYPTAPSVALEGENAQTVLWSAAMGERDLDEAIEDLNTRYNAALENDIKLGKVKRLVIKDFDPMNPSAGTVEYLDH